MNKLKLLSAILLTSIIAAMTISRCMIGGKEPVDYVNLFIGTKGEGNVLPGPQMPHGMVKLGPDNVNFPLSGYDYENNQIAGFSHTHLQGTGGGAYGNILLLPLIGNLNRISHGKCFSEFNHEHESASPGYYSVKLDAFDVIAELTATEHAGFHRYTFPESKDAHILIDVNHSLEKNCSDGYVKVVNKKEIQGYGIYGYPIYFYAKFNRAFDEYGVWKGCELVRTYVPIPESALIPPAANPGQHGLKGEYFNNKHFSGKPVFTRIDKTINFRWGTHKCDERLPIDNYSIRWTGKLIAPVSGVYKLRLDGDDGIRFFLDDKLLIDQWVDRGETADIVSVDLVSGKKYDIRIDYYENDGVSLARLKWDLVPVKGELHAGADEESGRNIGVFVNYSTQKNEQIKVKVGISAVSIEQAQKNLEQEIPDWNFDGIHEKTRSVWNKLLNRIKVKGGSDEQKIKFYTALYHSLLAPTDYTEYDNYYSGFCGEGKVYPVQGRHFYNDDWCTWDTFRSTHPLQTIVEPKRQSDYVQSYIRMFEQGGRIPNCPGIASSGNGMIANHATSVITDIYMKGFREFDVEKVYEGMKKNAMERPGGSEELSFDYLNLGYVAYERDGAMREKGSVSITLESAYDDWCLAQMAKALGKEDDYRMFMKRAGNYKNHFDSTVGFMRPRHADGSWQAPFDPASNAGSSNGFTESNSWQMTWFVPHDMQGLINLMDGRENFVKKLNTYFEEKHHNPGNEPDFINPFLFNYVGAPWKTQGITREIMKHSYGTNPGGLSGNDDSGAMSAWYVFSAMGFYPVCPGSNVYVIASPIFHKVTITLDRNYFNGDTFVIEARNVSKENKYIQSATLNGKPLNKPWITHSDIVNGGKLIFIMGAEPNKNWGNKPEDAPPSISKQGKNNLNQED